MKHSESTYGANHPRFNWSHADEAERLSQAGLTSEDLGKESWQTNNNTFWTLVSISPVTWVSSGGTGGGFASEEKIYTDTTNKIVGPLAQEPSSVSSVTLTPLGGVLQEYSVSYTVREVTGGTTPGYYVCVSTTSTAPGGGMFSGGTNPGTGIDTILASGSKTRITYPI